MDFKTLITRLWYYKRLSHIAGRCISPSETDYIPKIQLLTRKAVILRMNFFLLKCVYFRYRS